MGLFEKAQERQYKKMAKKEENLENMSYRLGIQDLDINELYMVDELLGSIGADAVLDYPLFSNMHGGSKAEKDMLSYMWLMVRQNWLILNQLSKLNKSMSELLKMEKEYEEDIQNAKSKGK